MTLAVTLARIPVKSRILVNDGLLWLCGDVSVEIT